MKEFPEMNWSGFVKKSIEEKAKKLAKLDELKKELENQSDWVSLEPSLYQDLLKKADTIPIKDNEITDLKDRIDEQSKTIHELAKAITSIISKQ